MNEINEKVKQGYDSAKLPEELRLRVRREFLAAAETEREGGITMSKRIKKPAAIAIIAAATLTVGITAGAAVTGILHKESVDTQLGEGSAEYVETNMEFRSYSTENEYMRITADAVFCDGNSVVMYVTREKLKDGYLPDNISFNAEHTDGTKPKYAGVSNKNDFSINKDGMTYELYHVDGVKEGEPIVLDFIDTTEFVDMMYSLDEEGRNELFAREDYDEYHDMMIHPETVQGLTLTIDTTPNVTLSTFADEQGREWYLSYYRMDTNDYELGEAVFGEFTLKNSVTGEQRTVSINGGAGGGFVDGKVLSNYSYNFAELVSDLDNYDMVEIEGVGTFYRQ